MSNKRYSLSQFGIYYQNVGVLMQVYILQILEVETKLIKILKQRATKMRTNFEGKSEVSKFM